MFEEKFTQGHQVVCVCVCVCDLAVEAQDEDVKQLFFHLGAVLISSYRLHYSC